MTEIWLNLLRKKWETYELSACMHAKSLQSCPTLCNPMDYSLPGSFVHGILQARILEWVAMPSSRGSSPLGDGTLVSYIPCVGRQVLYCQSHLGIPVSSSVKPNRDKGRDGAHLSEVVQVSRCSCLLLSASKEEPCLIPLHCLCGFLGEVGRGDFVKYFYWCIVNLKCFLSFRTAATRISYTYTYIHSFLDSFFHIGHSEY